MSALPAGPLKLVLIDDAAAARNAQRSEGVVEPFVTVLVLNEERDVIEKIRGVGFSTSGPMQLMYAQLGSLVPSLRTRLHAALSTTAEVTVAEIASPERAEQDPAATPAPPTRAPKKSAAKPVIKTQE